MTKEKAYGQGLPGALGGTGTWVSVDRELPRWGRAGMAAMSQEQRAVKRSNALGLHMVTELQNS